MIKQRGPIVYKKMLFLFVFAIFKFLMFCITIISFFINFYFVFFCFCWLCDDVIFLLFWFGYINSIWAKRRYILLLKNKLNAKLSTYDVINNVGSARNCKIVIDAKTGNNFITMTSSIQKFSMKKLILCNVWYPLQLSLFRFKD